MIKKIIQSGFFKSMMVLASGSIAGAIIIAVCEVARTWIFPKDAVGVYAFLLAVPLTFISVTSLRYDISIVIEEDERKALGLVKLSGLLSIGISVLVTLGFIIFIVCFHHDYIQYLYVTPAIFLIMLGYGINNILNSYNNRYKEYGAISKKYVIRTSIQYLSAIILGVIIVQHLDYPEMSIAIMIFPYGIGLLAGTKSQARGVLSRKEELKSIGLKEMFEVAKKHRRQAYYSSPALFVNSFSFSIITFIIEDLFGTTALAFYSISDRVLGLPISLISGNVAKVYIEEASREYEKTGKFVIAFKKSFTFLAALAIPLFFIMFLLAPPICGFLLGTGWDVAGDYIRILALMFSFRLIGTAISQSLAVCNKQGWELVINCSLVLSSVLSALLATMFEGNVYFFLKALCISRSICYLGLIVLVFLFSKGIGLKVKQPKE